MPIQRIITSEKVPIKIFANDLEETALQQLKNLAKLPIVFRQIMAMPDVHTGIGATVGAVVPTQSAIIPAAVGVDIGCGMSAVCLSLQANSLPTSLRKIRSHIEHIIPVGFDENPLSAIAINAALPLKEGLEKIWINHPQLLSMQKKPQERWLAQLGTLGGGNHFIELCLDEKQFIWVILHSGSRGIGNVIGRYFIALAKQDMEKIHQHLPDKDLAYLSEGTAHFDSYVEALTWAQNYAHCNREVMMNRIIQVLHEELPPFTLRHEVIQCHHNYVALEKHFGKEVYVTRKGAIRAGKDELGIIPGSMGAASFIVRGKGNPESFLSCSHGAGRRMSRHQAKRQFTVEDLRIQTQGIECRKTCNVIDEIPAAYKDIHQVMSLQSDLVDIVHTLKQVLCIKG